MQLLINYLQVLQLGSHSRHFPEFRSDMKLEAQGHLLLEFNPKDDSWHSVHLARSRGSQALHVDLQGIHKILDFEFGSKTDAKPFRQIHFFNIGSID